MKISCLALFCCLLVASVVAQEDVLIPPISHEDAFDVAKGGSILESSRTIDGYDINNVIGAFRGQGEYGRCLMKDYDIVNAPYPANFRDYFVIEVPNEIPLIGVRLMLAHDLVPIRDATRFVVWADEDGDQSFEKKLIDYPIVYRGMVPVPGVVIGFGVCDTNLMFTLSLAKRFKCEIYRGVLPIHPVISYGTRLVEVDAITATNDQLPETVLTTPTQGQIFFEGSEVELSATTSDPDGILRVDYYLNGTLTTSSSTAPDYKVKTPQLFANEYKLVAKGVDKLGGVGSSEEVTIFVRPPGQEIRLEGPKIESGLFSFTLLGVTPGVTNIVYGTSNLLQWEAVSTNVPSADVFEVKDLPVLGNRFFKATQF